MSRLLPMVSLVALVGCGAAPPPAPPPEAPPPRAPPPSPTSVTVANPGGDSADPELYALELLEREVFAPRADRRGSFTLRLPDARHWRRVTLWGYPTRAAYRFGDAHYGIVAVWYRPAKGPDDPESCLKRFIAEGRPDAEAFGVRATEVRLVKTLQQGDVTSKPMVVDVIDADMGSDKAYAGAVAAYTSWPGTCLIQGFVVVAGKHRALAERVRERWIREAAPRLTWSPRVTQAPTFEAR